MVVKMVGRGEAWVGLTDSDDIADGQREGLPIQALTMSAETLLIPNTVAVRPRCSASRSSPAPFRVFATASGDATSGGGQCPGERFHRQRLRPTLKVNWDILLRDLEPSTASLNEIFLR